MVPPAVAATTQDATVYSQLPPEARKAVNAIRASCKELGDPEPDGDAGLQIIDLDGNGSHDFVVDVENVCANRISGGNCSNRGCDLKIWKQTGRNSWKKVFDEHQGKFWLSLDYEGRFRLLAVTVIGGNAHCKAAPIEPSSHEYCDALVFWKNGTWEWKPIR